MPRFTLQSDSEDRTEQIGAALARILRPRDVVALHGQLGAGKTALVRGVARGLGMDPGAVSSPTFVVAHEYESARAPMPLWHLDAYRLGGSDELETIGWDRVVDGRGPVLIEWAERIADALPQPGAEERADLRLSHTGPESRQIELDLPPSWAVREGFSGLAELVVGPKGALPEGWIRCAITRRPVPPDSPAYPFADERARMADLNRWLTGGYTVSRELSQDDVDDPDLMK